MNALTLIAKFTDQTPEADVVDVFQSAPLDAVHALQQFRKAVSANSTPVDQRQTYLDIINRACDHIRGPVEGGFGEDHAVCFAYARLLSSLYRYDEAIFHYRRVLENDPANIKAQQHLCVAILDDNDIQPEQIQEAISLAESATEMDASDFSYSCLGRAYVAAGRYDDAKCAFVSGVWLDSFKSQNANAHLRRNLSEVYRRYLETPRASLPHAKRAYELLPGNKHVKAEYALSLYENEHYRDALPLLRQARSANPKNRFVGIAHCDCLIHLGMHPEALGVARSLDAVNGSPEISCRKQLEVYRCARDYSEEAFAVCDRVASEFPTHIGATQEAAKFYYDAGTRDKAKPLIEGLRRMKALNDDVLKAMFASDIHPATQRGHRSFG